MEGNSLTRIETKQLMMDNVTIDGKSFKDISEMRGHDEVVQEIFKIGKGDIRISEKRIKNMHKAIMHEDDPAKRDFIGKWKTTDNHLINYRGEKFYFLPHSEVPDAMHELLNETNADIDALKSGKKDRKHPVLIAFDFHLKYVRIHPFYDGNGRTARLLTNLLLISFGYPPFLLSEKSRESYNRILAEIQGYGGDSKDFHVLLGNLLIESQQLVLDAIAGKDISDDDDIDKEILLWKQGLSEKEIDLIKRDIVKIPKLYEDSLRSLFDSFLEKHNQFSDLFIERNVVNYIGTTLGGGGDNGLVFFEGWLDYEKKYEDIINSVQDMQKRSMILDRLASQSDTYKKMSRVGYVSELSLRINFIGFVKNGVHVFNASSEIKVIFDQFKYYVLDENGERIEEFQKFYSQSYSDDEIKKIVNRSTKYFLEKLKRNLKS
ncbi:MAG: Fic family protein [Flavobacteriales bacterium]|nr:Fic family protein [Flavobacteriales bacterium]